MGTAVLLVVFPFLMAYAASSDLLTMTIPNWVSGALVVAFAVVAVASGLGWVEIGLHVGAAVLTLCLTFTLFAVGQIGGGDAKLAAATAIWFGTDSMLDYLFVASILGGFLTLALLAGRSYPLPPHIARLPFAVRLHDRRTGIPYGIALAGAGLLVVPQTALWSNVFGF